MSKGEVLSKCGYRCDLCHAYAPNVASDDRRPELSDGWFAVYGFRIPPEQILCEGRVSGDNPALIDKGCPVWPCVVVKCIPNCASCPDYPCDKLGRPLGDAEYELLVRPYESRARLDALRRGR